MLFRGAAGRAPPVEKFFIVLFAEAILGAAVGEMALGHPVHGMVAGVDADM